MEVIEISYMIVVGALLVLASVIISGPVVGRMQSRVESLDEELSNTQQDQKLSHEAIQRSYSHYATAEIKLTLIKIHGTAKTGETTKEVIKGIQQGVLERYVAANGAAPTEEEWKQIDDIGLRALADPVTGFKELSDLSASLMESWQQRYNALTITIQDKRKASGHLKGRLSLWQNIAITLQVIAIIVVMLKDVTSTETSSEPVTSSNSKVVNCFPFPAPCRPLQSNHY